MPYYRVPSTNYRSLSSQQRKVRQVQRDLSFRWPNNLVPYFVTRNVTANVQKSVKLAIAELERKTCLRFENVDPAQTKYEDSVRIVDLGSCSSPIGRLQIGVQDVSLTRNCWGMGTSIHELMHAIGIEHTQSRSDRNRYLDILLRNIDRRDLPNFELLSSRLWTNLVPYDYGSVMHYSADSFAIKDDEQTMLPKDRAYIETMGSMIPNFYDFDQINRYYECYDKCQTTATVCQNGGTPNPNNCSTCICPLGFGGDLCDQRPSGCGSTFQTTSDWKRQQLSVRFDRKDDQYFTFCNFWFTAPENRRIQVIYELNSDSIRRQICSFGCYEGGIEVKHLEDLRITNDRDCCMTSALNVTTTNNPLPVILYTSGPSVIYNFSFRYI